MPQAVTWAISAIAATGIGTAAATAIVKFAATALVNLALSAVLGPKQPKQPDLKRDLAGEKSKPHYRTVYGRDLAVGTPAPIRVRGRDLYGCWILNSRPSSLTDFVLYLDKREVEFTGDPFDFSGGGGEGTNDLFADRMRFWIGRGDQTSPPAQILSEAPWAAGEDDELFKATDGWQGRTVIWMKLVGGGSEFANRWPAGAQVLVEVEGNWTKVWDPRDVAQDADDPATWEYSANHALVILDAARNNPVKPYQLQNLMLEQFIAAANIADQNVPLKAGGNEKRYTIGGTVVWSDAELEDQLGPLFLAGAAQPIRVGGKLGIAPGAWEEPSYTLTDIMEGGFEYVGTTDGDSMKTQLRVSYTSAERLYEDAELEPWNIPGALAADGGLPSVGELDLGFAGSATQAMRVRKIEGLRMRRQRTFSLVAPPTALKLIGGSTLTVELPAPWDRFDGTYEVLSTNPSLDLVGESGVAMRVGLTVLRTYADIYAWDASEEEDIEAVEFDADRPALTPPTNLIAFNGSRVIGGNRIPRIRFTFTRAESYRVNMYEWESRPSGTAWQPGGFISEDRDGTAPLAFIDPVIPGTSYDIRVRSVSGELKSTWLVLSDFVAANPASAVPAPTPISAAGGAGKIDATFRSPNNADYRGMTIWSATTNNSALAVMIAGPVYSAANTSIVATEIGLGSGATRYYFARSLDQFGAPSAFSAAVSATST